MAAYLSINRFDIMNLFLLGSLCFCAAINPINSSDWDMGFPEISEYVGVDNCTQCDDDMQRSCLCYSYVGMSKCIICCPNILCCTCFDCALCRHETKIKRELIVMIQIVISVLFGFGIIGLIIVYCKICHRARHTPASRRQCIAFQEEHHCSTIEDLRERPPSYNEIIRSAPPVYTPSRISAPPLYTSPYNRTSMQEAPPSYPGTPKPQGKSQDSNEPPFSPPVAQYM